MTPTRTALGLSRSIALSGERWSDQAQEVFDAALTEQDELHSLLGAALKLIDSVDDHDWSNQTADWRRDATDFRQRWVTIGKVTDD